LEDSGELFAGFGRGQEKSGEHSGEQNRTTVSEADRGDLKKRNHGKKMGTRGREHAFQETSIEGNVCPSATVHP